MAHCMNLLGHLTIFEHILGGCTCGDASCYLWRYIFYYFMEFWHGQNPNSPLSPWICLVEMVHLLFWGLTTSFLVERSIYLAPWTFIHGVGCLGNQDSHMWISYMHFVDHLLFLKVGYGAFSQEAYFIVLSLMHLGGFTL
jgi:hypothetical protein